MNFLLTHYKQAICALSLTFILTGITILLIYTSKQHPQFKYDKQPSVKSILLQKPTIKAITVGSSHSNGVDFETFGNDGEYLNISGADIFEAAYTAEQFIGKTSSLKTIYMAIAYPIFRLNNAKTRPSARIRNYYLLPRPIIPCTQLINNDIVNCIKALILPITRYDNWEAVFSKKLSKLNLKQTQRRSTHSNLSSFSIHKRAKHHIRLFEKGSDFIQANTKKQLQYTIQKLQQNDVNIVFFTPPYHPSYVEFIKNFNPNLIKTTHSIMDELSEKHGVFYKDYNSLKLPLSAFKNADHLNKLGSQWFTAELKNDIEHFTPIH